MIKETDDDRMIREFLHAGKEDITDNGFTDKVMRKLPVQKKRRMLLWNVLASLICVAMFFAFDGFHAIIELFRQLFVAAVRGGYADGFDIRTGLIVLVVLAFLGVRKAWSLI